MEQTLIEKHLEAIENNKGDWKVFDGCIRELDETKAAKSCEAITLAYCEEKNKELQSELDRKFKEWENQKETIGNFHGVMKKHCDKYPDSENLDLFITDLERRLSIAEKALEEIYQKTTQDEICFIINEAQIKIKTNKLLYPWKIQNEQHSQNWKQIQ